MKIFTLVPFPHWIEIKENEEGGYDINPFAESL